jgi:hypothetical protein
MGTAGVTLPPPLPYLPPYLTLPHLTSLPTLPYLAIPPLLPYLDPPYLPRYLTKPETPNRWWGSRGRRQCFPNPKHSQLLARPQPMF